MKKILLIAGIVLLVLLVGGNESVFGLGQPFKVTLSATVNPQQNTVTGTAVGTQVGEGRFVATVMILSPNFTNDISNTGCNPFTLDLSIATQSGELITIRAYGASCNILVTFNQGQVAGGMYRITGGSGRFQGASGVGTFSGEVAAVTASLTASLEGSINLVP